MTENADDPWTTEDLEHVRSEAERFNAQVCDLRRAYLALLETARGDRRRRHSPVFEVAVGRRLLDFNLVV